MPGARTALDPEDDEPESRARPAAGAAAASAAFRIDASDLGFLRSIGIDPTRRPRARRRT
jgi:hypothetical protein